MSTSVNSGNGYVYPDKYFKLMTNLDMAGEGYSATTGTTTLPYAKYGSYNVGDTFTEGDYTYTVTSKTTPTTTTETIRFYYDYGYNLDDNGEILDYPPYECDDIFESVGSDEVIVIDYYEAREGIEEDGSPMGGIVLRNPVEINGQDIHMSGYEDMAWYTETDMSEGDILCSGEYYWVYDLEATITFVKGDVTCRYTYSKGKVFQPIGNMDDGKPMRAFGGNFDGNGYTIGNIILAVQSNYVGLFGLLFSGNNDITIKNLNIIYDYIPSTSNSYTHFGGLCGSVIAHYTHNMSIDNVNIEYNNIACSYKASESSSTYIGGLIGKADGYTLRYANVSNCSVTGFNATILAQANIDYIASDYPLYAGGIVAYAANTNITKSRSNASITVQYQDYKNVGGIVGNGFNCNIENCLFDGNIIQSFQHECTDIYSCIGGIVGCTSRTSIISNNLFQGEIQYYPASSYSTGGQSEYVGTILGLVYDSTSNVTIKNNISNGIFKSHLTVAKYERAGGVFGGGFTSMIYTPNAYNASKTTIIKTSYTPSWAYTGSTTDEDMKLASTYADWEAFDEHWIIDPKINNGYPMLRAFVDVAKVTGFDGSGTEADPYLIKTHQDLLGMASYYNDNILFEKTDIYWQLANNIDVSVDAKGLPIHFTPICYNKEFDGYFDGNSKTISGLLIDNQYSYTGLFGTIGANHYVKNLTVRGNIYWDQAYAVGGVAGRVMTGGYLQNCIFNGNIIGVLNTKTSTECHGVVGNYGIGGAIDCSATYKDIKYAKIGGTADSPTYTYYLYDWAQINTNLYNRQVS